MHWIQKKSKHALGIIIEKLLEINSFASNLSMVKAYLLVLWLYDSLCQKIGIYLPNVHIGLSLSILSLFVEQSMSTEQNEY